MNLKVLQQEHTLYVTSPVYLLQTEAVHCTIIYMQYVGAKFLLGASSSRRSVTMLQSKVA